ncbi:hypothetical protein [Halobellus captivus]|uniref:hypothetical protein n=1 Tax=Halobellus captivus TaxID=2592614 RepID=UPI00119FBC5C|nr:hypothetical protein [Halobellus captivus]
MSDVSITLFSDPLSIDAYRRRPTRSRAEYVFGDVDITYRCAVSVPHSLDNTQSTAEIRSRSDGGGMPVDSSVTADGFPSSWTACEAVATARELGGTDAAFALAREIADRTFAAGQPTATPEAIREAAEVVPGLDGRSVADAVGSRRATAAVGRDLELARQTVAKLSAFDVRGTPGREPLRPRSALDSPEDDGVGADGRAEAADPETGVDGADPTADVDGGDSQDVANEDGPQDDSDEDGPRDDNAQVSNSPRTPDAVFTAPVYRVDGPSGTTVVDGAAGFDALRDAVRKYDPDLGETEQTTETQSRNVMQQYGAAPMNAESFSPEDHGERAIDVLDSLPSASTTEISACLDVTEETCRITLHRLKREGDVRRLTTGAWTRVPEE